MSRALWTRLFYFSASFSRRGRIHGHNYALAVTVFFSDAWDEGAVEKKINRGLIEKIHSRDLGLDVDWFKKMEITDHRLLKVFSKIIAREIKPVRLHSLTLERDSRTRLFLPHG